MIDKKLAHQAPLGLALFKLRRMYGQLVRHQLWQHDLYHGQDIILGILDRVGPCSQTELRQRLQIQHTTVVKTIMRLERKGYVQRYKLATDRRVTMVELTPAGHDLAKELAQVWITSEDVITAGLTPAEQAEFIRLTKKITANISKKLDEYHKEGEEKRCGR